MAYWFHELPPHRALAALPDRNEVGAAYFAIATPTSRSISAITASPDPLAAVGRLEVVVDE
jgi:hypothetical protein